MGRCTRKEDYTDRPWLFVTKLNGHFALSIFSTCLSSCAWSLWLRNWICPEGRNWLRMTAIFSDLSISCLWASIIASSKFKQVLTSAFFCSCDVMCSTTNLVMMERMVSACIQFSSSSHSNTYAHLHTDTSGACYMERSLKLTHLWPATQQSCLQGRCLPQRFYRE